MQLDLKWREYQYPWPKKLGIDEHFFRRYKGRSEFVTVFTDFENSRLREVCQGRSTSEITPQLLHIEGKENVKIVCIDLCSTYRRFCKTHFPNANLVADKFHVLKLLTPALFKERKACSKTNANRVAQKFLLTPARNLDYFDRVAFHKKLAEFPKLNELYLWKERLHGFYRIKGFDRAVKALDILIEQMKKSLLPEIKTLAKTLKQWGTEITNYFRYKVTNGMTEGYNNIAKLVQRRAFGYKSFPNYRLRVLNACA